MSSVSTWIREKGGDFVMHLLVAIIVGVFASAMATYVQQSRLRQTSKEQGEQITSLQAEQKSQRQTLFTLSERLSVLATKIDLLLQQQGISPKRPYRRTLPEIDSLQ